MKKISMASSFCSCVQTIRGRGHSPRKRGGPFPCGFRPPRFHPGEITVERLHGTAGARNSPD
jgi:hypothetical protein